VKKLNYKIFFSDLVKAFRGDGFFRKFTPILRERSSFPFTKVEYGRNKSDNESGGSQLKIWCTNDYLNMSHDDDVIDESKLRRGIKTTNSIWGNQSSILVGDYLLSRCFEMMVEDGNLEILRLLSSINGQDTNTNNIIIGIGQRIIKIGAASEFMPIKHIPNQNNNSPK